MGRVSYNPTISSMVAYSNHSLSVLRALGAEPIDRQQILDFIGTYRKSTGGGAYAFSNSAGKPADPLSTLLLIEAYTNLGEEIDSKWAAVTIKYLQNLQNSDGGFGYAGLSNTRSSWACWKGLKLLGSEPLNKKGFTDWVNSLSNADGGFGFMRGFSSDIQSTCFAVEVLGYDIGYANNKDGSAARLDDLAGRQKCQPRTCKSAD